MRKILIKRTSTMSIQYKPSKAYIDKELDKVAEDQRHVRRLAIDIAWMLTGPTSAGNAAALVDKLFASYSPEDIAATMQEAAERFFRSKKELYPEVISSELLEFDDEDCDNIR